METIKIYRTEIYPELILDKDNGIFEIKGISLPENGIEFYQPILNFLDEYIKSPKKVTLFVFNLRFFNISSSKMILFILYKLQKLRETGNTVLITWCYEDNYIYEAGKDFEQMCKLSFRFKAVFEEKILN
jgi:hypothetical protein